MEPYWQADIKVAGRPVSVLFQGGEWSCDDDAVLADFEGVLVGDMMDLDYNPFISGQWSDIFAAALRKVAPVYGISTNMDYVNEEQSEDAVN